MSGKALILKAVIYRLIAFVFSSIILSVLTGNIGKALCFSLVLEAAKTGVYFAYDWAWVVILRKINAKKYKDCYVDIGGVDDRPYVSLNSISYEEFMGEDS